MNSLLGRVGHWLSWYEIIGSADDNVESEDSKNGGGFSGSNEKQGVMSKMKEGLTKVAHPHHGK